MKSRNFRRALAAIAVSLSALPAAADSERITAFVLKTRVTGDGAYGGCMVALSANPADLLPGCKNTWLAFSCDGTYTDPVSAYRMLDQAQLALATGMEVLVLFTDEKKHDGYCVASRISVGS